MTSYTEDKIYGLNNEEKYLESLSKYFNTTFKKYVSEFSLLDFYSYDEKIFIEMKSRRINHNQYPTAIFNAHKIDEFNRLNKNNDSKFYIVFIYLDGIYYIEYKKDIFNKFEIKKFKRNERQGITDYLNVCYFIPTNLLIKINH